MVGSMLLPRAEKRKRVPFAIRSRANSPKMADWDRCSVMEVEHRLNRGTVGNELEFVAGDGVERPAYEVERALNSCRAVEGWKAASEDFTHCPRFWQLANTVARSVLQEEDALDPCIPLFRKRRLAVPWCAVHAQIPIIQAQDDPIVTEDERIWRGFPDSRS